MQHSGTPGCKKTWLTQKNEKCECGKIFSTNTSQGHWAKPYTKNKGSQPVKHEGNRWQQETQKPQTSEKQEEGW
jgi:hypothetical protein